MTSKIKRVAMLFAGGPAPGANAVISTAAYAFLNANVEVLGIRHGYSKLIDFDGSRDLVEGDAYMRITHDQLHHSRTSQGIMIGTARTNPGKSVSAPEHLTVAERIAPIKRVVAALRSLPSRAMAASSVRSRPRRSPKRDQPIAAIPAARKSSANRPRRPARTTHTSSVRPCARAVAALRPDAR